MRERRWSQLPFYTPRGLLIELDKLSAEVANANLPYNLASLRTNSLKTYREGRQCALFCYGIGQRLGTEVRFAFAEEQDIDFVARFKSDDTTIFVPTQMKEVVPECISNSSTLQREIDKLTKYVDSSDLVVVFHLNRDTQIIPKQLDFSAVKIGQLWVVGYTGQENEWRLLGDFLCEPLQSSVFRYPES